MKKTAIILIMLLLSSMTFAQVSVWDGTWEPWTHGTGTEADPFLIENARQLAYLAYRVNNGLDAGGGHVSNHDYHYKLMVDVDLNGSENFQWTPIGYWNSETDYQCFGGYFNGNNHAISGMYINSNARNVGFFGNTNGANLVNTQLYGDIASSNNHVVGGFIGDASFTIVKNCMNYCDIYLIESYSGGIVGYMGGDSQIINCCNIGSITSTSPGGGCVAGIVGGANAFSSLKIVNCYNRGNIYGDIWCKGGIVGECPNTISIINSYNVGALNDKKYFCGGIVGLCRDDKNSISNCYFLNTCGGNDTYGGQPMSAEAMRSSEFVETLNDGSCNWEYDWNNTNSGYPILTGIMVSVSTSYATNVTQTHAVLNGLINTENTSVLSQGFEYKKTLDYNYQTVNVSGNGNISTTILGLEPNIQYQYRTFCTTSNCETHYGEENTFTTLPVSVTTYNAMDVTSSSAILHGSIDIGDATLVNKGFEYRIVGEQNYTTIYANGNGNDFTEQLFDLQMNTIYEYRAFMNIADVSYWNMYYGTTKTFEVSWLNSDTICITNSDMLHWVSEQCNSGTTFEGYYIKLMNDITLPLNVPNNMTSIGAYPNYPFKGTFDGNGKLITNLYIDQPNTPYQGFFGYTLNANLYNVGLVNITASGRNYTGGMVAYAKNTHLRDCYVNGGTLFALSYCGGLIGYQEQGTNSIVSGCYNTCSVNGNHYVGGLIGFSNYSTVRNSYVAGRVSGQGNGIGAIIGGANEVLMYYCYFSTELTGQTNAIGENNFKDGGEGLTNAQMRDPQFVNTLNQNLMTPVWMADYANHINNGFPIIKWQRPGTGMEEHEAAKSCISLFPNPANDFVIIQSDDSSVSLKHMEVYDIMGRKVMSKVLDGQSKEFSIDKLHAGVYHVRVQTDNGHYTNIKLVVQ